MKRGGVGVEARPEEVWQQTAVLSGVSKEFTDSYYAGKRKAVANRLGEVIEYEAPKRPADIGLTRAQQSFVYLPLAGPIRRSTSYVSAGVTSGVEVGGA